MKAVEGEKVTSDQSLFLLKESNVQAWISLRVLPEAKANKKTLKSQNLKISFIQGSKGARVRASRTKDKSQLGIDLFAEGLSL